MAQATMAKRVEALEAQGNATTTALEALTNAITALTQAGKTPAPASNKSSAKQGRKANKAKAERKARREANIAAGRMTTALYGCETTGCTWSGSYNKAPADKHTLLVGHKAVELA